MADGKKIVRGDKIKVKDAGEVVVVAVDPYNVCFTTPGGNRRHMPLPEFEQLIKA